MAGRPHPDSVYRDSPRVGRPRWLTAHRASCGRVDTSLIDVSRRLQRSVTHACLRMALATKRSASVDTSLLLVTVVALTSFVGCSAGTETTPTGTPPPGTDDQEPMLREVIWPDVSADTCVEVFQSPSSMSYYRKSWDAERGVLTAETSSTPAFTGAIHFAKRYNAAKDIAISVGFRRNGDFQNFQNDYQYDTSGNLTQNRLSYPTQPDVMTPSTANMSSARELTNEYDDQNRLLASTERNVFESAPAREIRRVFHEDTLGRCSRIETAHEGDLQVIETILYDGEGRVARVESTSVRPDLPPKDCRSVTLTTYDAKGRVKSSRIRPCEDDTDERASMITTYKYRSDGFSEVELLDFMNDMPNDTITKQDGGTQSVTRVIVSRNPACAAMDALLQPPQNPWVAVLVSPRDKRCWIR
jgi:hypothetical protein